MHHQCLSSSSEGDLNGVSGANGASTFVYGVTNKKPPDKNIVINVSNINSNNNNKSNQHVIANDDHHNAPLQDKDSIITESNIIAIVTPDSQNNHSSLQ